ncbi:MAG TPA: glucosidase [Fimbriiglobus sp.]|nr:glucosidase [Fimbriiglobus sp.]
MNPTTAEDARLEEDRTGRVNWRRWGPYLAERAWGTVREDYSDDGEAWAYFPHDLARSKAYRWGEDGLAGVCDRYQLLCFALALWNGRDPILKERAFGLVPTEGNHGEDVKEYYHYLDATPTFSYARYLYRYPQAEFPYLRLIRESRRRTLHDPEYELLDTGVFDGDRYFDVYVEYAKAGPDDLCIRVEACNRGPAPAELHLLPHLWFRNTWAWGERPKPEPVIRPGPAGDGYVSLLADDRSAEPLMNLLTPYRLGERYLYAETGGRPLFTDNETNGERVFGPQARSRSRFVKDAFHRYIIGGEECINPRQTGTKACLHYPGRLIPAGGSRVLRLRLTAEPLASPLVNVDQIVAVRRREADEFYARLHPPKATPDEWLVQRQALAGMVWTKQVYLFDVAAWLDGDNPAWLPPPSRRTIRNVHWRHLNSQRVLSMPDTWEYPWFAAWDLAFHTIPLARIDPEFAKEQLWLLLFEQFQHPNGQVPAYEWEFSDLNPPVHAWAVWRVYNMDRLQTGRADRVFLEKCFHKLLMNFTWWVNRVDADGYNVFEGGFLGMDNVAVHDRSKRPADGSVLKQSDGTGWVGMFCLNLMRIALELAKENPAYQGLATKFLEHFVHIGSAMNHMGDGNYELWSEADGFFYDVLRFPDGQFQTCRVRSMVGLIPLFAVERLEERWIEPFTDFRLNLEWFLRNRSGPASRCITTLLRDGEKVHVLSLTTPRQLRRVLRRVWDPDEFRGEYGLRSLSKAHGREPYLSAGGAVGYEPGESRTWLKGGNSNWRGPVWFPTAFLMIESLRKLAKGFGNDFAVESPVPGEGSVTLGAMARGFAERLIALFARGADGRRPALGPSPRFQDDPHWRDCLLFHEYFHGETGEGLGASHQTGWTGLVASLIDEWRK